MTNFELLKDLHSVCKFIGNEKPGLASNGELRRWFDGAVLINNKRVLFNDEVEYPIVSFVLFPKGKRRCTII